jgi:hypothetical protein
MTPFAVMARYFWLIAIGVTGVGWLIFRKNARGYIKKNPQLREGYVALLRGYLIWMNLPWLVMGIGCTVGGVPCLWDYMRPKDGNPYVLAWFGSLFLVWALGTSWLFGKGGAEKLATHPGAIQLAYGWQAKDITNPMLIKALWLVMLAGGLAGCVGMWFMDVPMATFR